MHEIVPLLAFMLIQILTMIRRRIKRFNHGQHHSEESELSIDDEVLQGYTYHGTMNLQETELMLRFSESMTRQTVCFNLSFKKMNNTD
jgi:hypothetical protein